MIPRAPVADPSAGKAVDYSRKWYSMAAVGAGIFMATLDGSIINVSLPTLVRDLGTNFTVIQWVVMAYLLTVTTLMLGFGRLADMIGKKKIYMLGFMVFTISSALCGLSPSVSWLIAFRVVQGLGAAMIMALGAAIVTEAFPPNERGKAMGMVGAIVSIGIVVGPPLGGLILSLASWRWIFFVNIPIGLLGTLMVGRFIVPMVPAGRQRFDYPGAAALFGSLLALLIGLSLGQQYGFANPIVVALIGAWFVILLLFIFLERRVPQPMVDLGLFGHTPLSVNLINGFLSFLCLGGIYILIPFYLEVVLGFETLRVGLLMGIVPVMLGLSSPISGMLSDRLGTRLITMLGLATLLGGYLALSTLNAQTSGPGFMVRIFALGLGMGIFLSPNNSAIMGAAPRDQLGIVSGMMAVSRTMGQTVGIAVIGTLWAARVKALSGGVIQGGATKAAIVAQVKGLQMTFWAVSAIIVVALALAMYGLIHERRRTGE